MLAAEFLGAAGGDLTVFETADRFAGVAGLAPAPRDSGRITGNHHHHPRRYDRRLLRVFYFSGLSALKIGVRRVVYVPPWKSVQVCKAWHPVWAPC